MYHYNGLGKSCYFKGQNETAPRKINLLYSRNHFSVITSLPAAFCVAFFCDICHGGSNSSDVHRCRFRCPCCNNKSPCSINIPNIRCKVCTRYFRGQNCLDRHLEKKIMRNGKQKNSICEKVKQCKTCRVLYKTTNSTQMWPYIL